MFEKGSVPGEANFSPIAFITPVLSIVSFLQRAIFQSEQNLQLVVATDTKYWNSN